MKSKPLFISLCALLFCSGYIKGQQSTIYPLLSMEIKTISTGSDTTSNGLPIPTDSIYFEAHMLISLFDTSGISAIQVKLGNHPGNYNLLQTNFDFDISGNLSAGTSYSRDGYNIDLGLGVFQGLSRFYSEVSIRKTDSSITSPAFFNQ